MRDNATYPEVELETAEGRIRLSVSQGTLVIAHLYEIDTVVYMEVDLATGEASVDPTFGLHLGISVPPQLGIQGGSRACRPRGRLDLL
jgi:hypothetical protein